MGQWDINRMGPDNTHCDAACRQFRFDLSSWPHSCAISHVPTTQGYCNNKAYPTWTATMTTHTDGDRCMVTVSGASVNGHADRCSCAWGAYPCTCPGKICQGRAADTPCKV